MSVNKHIIDVQTRGAVKSEKQIKGVSGALGGLAKQAGIAAAAYFGTRALLGGIRASVDAFARQELAEKKLEVALGRTSNMLLKQASALQKSTMFGDEAIIEAQALIGSFVKEEEAIAAATKATLDLAAAKGMDLTAAADLVSKTLGSSTNALSRYGIQVEGAVGSTERLNSLTENIADVFGGQATEQSKTLAGALESMENAIGDAGEALGETLAPMIISAANAVTFLAEGFQKLFRWQDKYKALAVETLGIISEQDAKILLLNQDLVENANAEKIMTAMLLELNKALGDSHQGVSMLDEDTQKWTKDMIEASIKSGDFNKMIEEQEFWGTELGDTLRALLLMYEQMPEGLTVSTDAQVLYNEQQLNNLKTQEDLVKMEQKFIELYPKKAKALGLVSKKQEQINSLASNYKELAIAQAIQDTYASARAQFKEFSKSYPAPLGQILGTAAAAAAISSGLKDVEQIKAAQYGADYVTSGPELIMVGDNPSGREHIQVTPLGGDPNINGPQGGGITLNISGNVMSDEFTEDIIVPRLQEALRLGNTL